MSVVAVPSPLEYLDLQMVRCRKLRQDKNTGCVFPVHMLGWGLAAMPSFTN